MEYKKSIVKGILNELRSEMQNDADKYYAQEVKAINNGKEVEATMRNLMAKQLTIVELKIGDAITRIEREHNIEQMRIKSKTIKI